jgi:FkbM family methyltransferase
MIISSRTLFENIKYKVINVLSILPFGKKIAILIGSYGSYRRNLGKNKFLGEQLQDMIAYMYLPKKKDGFFIDIGASDGLVCNNTYIFEKIGWKGICIEPQPDVFRNCLKRNRKCDCYNVALSSENDENVDFLKMHGMRNSSGLNKDMSESLKKLAEKYGKVEIIKVKTITFNELMKKYPDTTEIDFMSIDAEGHEIEILQAINFEKYKFKLITIEQNDGKVREYMRQNGYKIFLETGLDIMFIPENVAPTMNLAGGFSQRYLEAIKSP